MSHICALRVNFPDFHYKFLESQIQIFFLSPPLKLVSNYVCSLEWMGLNLYDSHDLGPRIIHTVILEYFNIKE